MKDLDINQYQTLVFDCDGVILDSNKVKTQAFYKAALPYGESAAQALVDYHVSHGGISRYKKFELFLQEVVGRTDIDKAELDGLLVVYAESVWQGLLNCEVAQGLYRLREKYTNGRWLIVSGGDQEELRRVFLRRNLDHLFDGGIFGSPDNKDIILARELEKGNIVRPGIFFGDSQYDYESAKRAGLDFAFVSGWSESAFNFSEADYVLEKLGVCI
ncbi:HAD family hydrolase [Pseudomonas sp. JM0905a]|uniref:HAD family hydrolase n=1 Tax=Pseudomonas sp. JM0905a TaxID=2772484 RepID=UPI001682931D|nr:HAD family hydrolase [Pseudomonas sp. JM0905a]MBD2837690.1 HAD family hydrolase [Pseudomonas sp. JM0905a]